MSVDDFDAMYGSGQTKMIFDIKGVYQKADFVNKGYHYWSL